MVQLLIMTWTWTLPIGITSYLRYISIIIDIRYIINYCGFCRYLHNNAIRSVGDKAFNGLHDLSTV